MARIGLGGGWHLLARIHLILATLGISGLIILLFPLSSLRIGRLILRRLMSRRTSLMLITLRGIDILLAALLWQILLLLLLVLGPSSPRDAGGLTNCRTGGGDGRGRVLPCSRMSLLW